MIWLLFLSISFASQLGIVEKEIQLYAEPTEVSPRVGAVHAKEIVAASSHSQEGFYKVRTQAGLIGYIGKEDITLIVHKGESLRDVPKVAEMPEGAADSVLVQVAKSEDVAEPVKLVPQTEPRFLFVGGATFSYLLASEGQPITGTRINYATSYMGTLGVRIGSGFELLARGETHGVVVPVSSNSVSILSTPLLIGAGLELGRTSVFRLTLMGMGGFTVPTVVQVTGSVIAGVTAYLPTGYGALVFELVPFAPLVLQLELGYRFLSATGLPTPLGVTIFSTPVQVNLSGITAGLNLGLRL